MVFSTTCGVCGWLLLASLPGAPPTDRTAACSITFGNPAGGSATLLAYEQREQTLVIVVTTVLWLLIHDSHPPAKHLLSLAGL